MGEGERRKAMGLAPRVLKPGEQIQVNVDPKDTTPRKCECGSEIFVLAFKMLNVSKLLSPTGKELNIPVQTFLCQKCGKLLDLTSDVAG